MTSMRRKWYWDKYKKVITTKVYLQCKKCRHNTHTELPLRVSPNYDCVGWKPKPFEFKWQCEECKRTYEIVDSFLIRNRELNKR